MPRIIAGDFGGRTIPGPPGSGTRPTSDRVREALFGRLDGWGVLQGARVLDLYAGTGALAFEAISRGAERALLVEKHAATARTLRSAAADLGIQTRCEIRAHRAEAVIEQLRGPVEDSGAEAPVSGFSLVFIDPPYDMETSEIDELLDRIGPLLSPEALVVVERSRRSPDLSWPEGWTDDGTKTYGDTVLRFGGPE